MLVSPRAYLLVIANSCEATKDSCSVDGYLHANFSLSSQEYLALVDPTGLVVSAYGSANGDYPEQRADISYGLSTRMDSTRVEPLFMPNPTPGFDNQHGFPRFVTDVSFDAKHGYFSRADLAPGGTLSRGIAMASEVGAVIRYTTDGSLPIPTNPAAQIYTSPIALTGSTTLRAAASRDGLLPSSVSTQSFLFVDDVVSQSSLGRPGSLLNMAERTMM